MLTPGRLLLIPAHTSLAYGCPGRFGITWLHFTAEDEAGADFFSLFNASLAKYDARAAALPHFKVLLSLHNDTTLAGELARRASLLSLLALVLEGVPPPPSPAAASLARFRPVLSYLERNPGGDCSVPRLAALAGLSPAGFTRAFTRCLGTSPARYALRRRIIRARERLSLEEVTPRELAAALGFADEFHFAKSFKRHTGLTPREYRASRRAPLP